MMKKMMLGVVVAMMALSVVACTPTTEKNKTGEVQNVEMPVSVGATSGAGVTDEKFADSDAPRLEIVSVYVPKEDGTGLVTKIESIEELNPQALVDLLIQYEVLEEGTESISFEAIGTPEEEAVGPGVVVAPVGYEIEDTRIDTGILDLNQLPEDEVIQSAVANTFLENMKASKITIQVNGEVIAENIVLVEEKEAE